MSQQIAQLLWLPATRSGMGHGGEVSGQLFLQRQGLAVAASASALLP